MYKKGQSGNPKGRPPMTFTLAQCLRRRLEAGKDEKLPVFSRIDAIAEKMIADAEQASVMIPGASPAYKLIFDRAYGQAPQETKVTVEKAPEIKINWE